MTDEENGIVEVVDEDGNTLEFEVVAEFEVEDKHYAVLAPCHGEGCECGLHDEDGELDGSDDDENGGDGQDDDEEEYLICRVEDDGQGGQNLVEIDDDEEYERVLEAMDELFADEVLGADDEDDDKG